MNTPIQPFSRIITPINSLEDFATHNFCELVHSSSYSKESIIKNITLEKKLIDFIPTYKSLEKDEILDYLKSFGKKPVINSQNYLLGAMAYLPRKDFLNSYNFDEYIAISDDEIKLPDGRDCWLYGRYTKHTKIREVCPIIKTSINPCYFLLAENM